MIRVRSTTIPVSITAFVAGGIAAVLAVLGVVSRASTDASLLQGSNTQAPVISESQTRFARSEQRSEPSVIPRTDVSDIAILRGLDLTVPVTGVEAKALRSSFHEARADGHTHEAMDILAPRNTPVVAVADGTIAKLFHSKAGGLTIYEFDGAERFAFYYAHLERYADGLDEHDRVRRGQVIGYVGTSGNAPKDTPHLHFAIFRLGPERHWWQGNAIDPFDVWKQGP